MDLIGKKIETVSLREALVRLKEIDDKGLPIYGFNPFGSIPFDDYITKLFGSKAVADFPGSEDILTEEDMAEIIDARSVSVIEDLLSNPTVNEKNEIVRNKILDIPEGYSFDDVLAKKPSLSILDEARVDYKSDEFDELPIAIEIGGKVFGTLGNFSMVIGKPKSGKTLFTTLLAGAAISGQDESNLLKVKLPEKKSKVVFFDTEQSKSHTALVGKRLMELIGDIESTQFDIFSLRRFSIDQRLQALEELFIRYDDIGLVIIDGIKDLVSEINNEKEASQIGNKLLEWTQRYNIHIVVVLHQNKGDKHARGHIGGELQNKAETTVSISKRKEGHVVAPEFTRNDDFISFVIGFKPVKLGKNETVIPFINLDQKVSKKSKGKGRISTTPQSTSIGTHQKILQELNEICLKEQNNKGEARDLIKGLAAKHQLDFGDNKAQKFLTYYLEKEWIQMKKPTGGGKSFVSVNIDSIK